MTGQEAVAVLELLEAHGWEPVTSQSDADESPVRYTGKLEGLEELLPGFGSIVTIGQGQLDECPSCYGGMTLEGMCSQCHRSAPEAFQIRKRPGCRLLPMPGNSE